MGLSETYEQLKRAYMRWLDTLGFAGTTVRHYGECTRQFLVWLEQKHIYAVALWTPTLVADFFDHLELRPNQRRKGHLLGAAHLNHYFSAVDKLLEFLHQQGLQRSPSPLLRRIRIDLQNRIANTTVLSTAEIKTLYNAIDSSYPHFALAQREAKHYQLRLIFALYYACGLRRSEGYKLTFDDIDFDKRTVFIHQGKGYKDRLIPMSQGVYQQLKEYLYEFRLSLRLPHKRLFIHTPGTLLLSLLHLQQCCDDESIRAKSICLHTLRHSIATHLLQNGMSMENIALFLGHGSLESTQLYTHLI